MTSTLTNPAIAAHEAARARWAVFATFMVAGLLVGAWVPHIALAKQRLDVPDGPFGLALLAIGAGAVLSMPLAGAMINRFGSAPVVLVTGLLFAFGFLLPVFAPGYLAFAAGGFVFGAGTGSMDVAMNAHGLAAEKALGRPIMSSLHAAWSVGCWLGTASGVWVIAQASPGVEACGAAALVVVLHVIACRFYLAPAADRGLSESHFGWPTRATIGLGGLCFLALMVEGSVADWSAIFTRERFAVDAAQAGLGFAFFQGGMSVSRFLGDAMRRRFGGVNIVVASALLAAVGMAWALLAPSFTLAFIGYVASGLGLGNLAPVLFAGGGRLEPDAPGRGIAAVVSMGYSGFLVGPPVIGFAAQATSLQLALGLTVIFALVIAAFTRTVAPAENF